MARIGQYRRKVYNLLYNNPICDYVENNNGKNEFNVLIIGNGWAGNEAFKASFWAGQYIDTTLNITVASKNATQYGNAVMSIEGPMPALKTFAIDKHYASICFKDLEIKEGFGQSELDVLEFDNIHYNYIIISLGETELNWLAASDIITALGGAIKANKIAYNGKIIINVFEESSGIINDADKNSLIEDGTRNNIEVNFFGYQNNKESYELERIAKNINFSYELKYDQRISKAVSDEKFDNSKHREFEETPHDYDTLEVINNFVGGDYAADSSLASAVHVPYKLSFCQTSGNHNALDVLADSIKTKSSLYYKLVALEHRRWNAYMATRGFRAPTFDEEEKYLFKHLNGRFNTHQDKTNLLHICMCDCFESESILSNDFNGSYKQWLKDPSALVLCELDRAALRCHQLTSRLSDRIDIQKQFDKIVGENSEYINLRKSIKKLMNDDENAVNLYVRSLSEAKEYAKKISWEELEKLCQVEKALEVVTICNQRMEFLSLDSQLIDMIPFCLWFEKRYGTMLIITDGVASDDVILPTLLNSKEVIICKKGSHNNKYETVVTRYLSNRNCEKITIEKFSNNAQTIYNKLYNLINERGVNNVVIGISTLSKNYSAILAIGMLIDAFGENLSVIQYNRNDGVVALAGNKCFEVGLTNKSFSVNEYIQLMGGSIQNEHSIYFESSYYDILSKLLRKYISVRTYEYFEDGKIKTSNYIPWIKASQFLEDNAKHVNLNKNITDKDAYEKLLKYTAEFDAKVYSICELDIFLQNLSNYKIIENLREIYNHSTITISFDYYDKKIPVILNEFELKPNFNKDIYFKKLVFSAYSGIKLINTCISDVDISKGNKHEDITASMIEFLKDLEKYKLIKYLEINENRVSFVFRDDETMNLFKNQGQSFELVLYHMMRESGMFDEVETGRKIAWSSNDKLFDEMVLEQIKAEKRDIIGYKGYKKICDSIKYDPVFKNAAPENEIDIIAIKNMNPIFVSCKTGKSNENGWIYEISSLSSQFNVEGALAITCDFSNDSHTQFAQRAYHTGISLLGIETLWDEKLFEKAMHQIIEEKVYKYNK